jgi:hypothetical protein
VFRNESNPCLGFIITGFHTAYNFTVPQGSERTYDFDKAEICPVTCGVRPYMKSWLCIVDTPYFAKTDAEGRFAIRDVPAGEYQVKVWHEAAGKLKKENGPLEVQLDPGATKELVFRVAAPKE